jgi:autotransporter-associated beta strand protein
VTRTLTIGKGNGSGTFSGTLSNNGGILAVTKIGTGTETLSGTNSYTGPTTVNAGTLAVNSSINSPTVVNGGSLLVSGTLSGSTAQINGGTLEVAAGGLVSSAAVTVSAGSLQVDTNGSISSPVTVTGGAAGGSGVFNGAVTVNSGGTFAPGQNGPGFVSATNNFTLNSGGHLAIDLNGTAGSTQYDQIAYSGSALALGGDLQLSLGYTPTVGDVFYLIVNLGGQNVSGAFSNAADLGNGTGLLTANGMQFLVSYSASHSLDALGFAPGQGQDVALQVFSVPEPGCCASLVGGLGLLGGLQRFRRRVR